MTHNSGLPKKIRRCQLCFLNIFDDAEHTCLPPEKIVSGLSTGVYVAAPLKLFEFEVYGEMYHLNANNDNFESVRDGEKLLSPSTDGLMLFKRTEGLIAASYEAASFKRFSFFVATPSNTSWRLLFRVDTASQYGLQFHKMDTELLMVNGRLVFPSQYKLSTVMVLGVIPLAISPQSLWMSFRVFANEFGEIDFGNFNGYTIPRCIGNQLEHKVIKLNKINLWSYSNPFNFVVVC